MEGIVFWTIRLMVGFTGLVLFGEEARISVTILVCLLFEFLGMLALMGPEASVLSLFEFSSLTGLIIGAGLSITRTRAPAWKLPACALATLLVLRGSSLVQLEAAKVAATWAVQAATIFGLPLGMLVASYTVQACAGLIRRIRAPSPPPS